ASPQDSRARPRGNLLQAGPLLRQGDFDAADRLAAEVARLKLPWAASDDSPAKVLQDVAKARTDPHALLTAARSALVRKDYNLAEKYARLADKNSSFFTFTTAIDPPP